MTELANRFDNSEDALENFVLAIMRKDIWELDLEDQPAEWDKYRQLMAHLELCRFVIEMFYNEAIERVSYIRNKEQQKYIDVLRKYIVDLGGNPIHCSYTLNSDL